MIDMPFWIWPIELSLSILNLCIDGRHHHQWKNSNKMNISICSRNSQGIRNCRLLFFYSLPTFNLRKKLLYKISICLCFGSSKSISCVELIIVVAFDSEFKTSKEITPFKLRKNYIFSSITDLKIIFCSGECNILDFYFELFNICHSSTACPLFISDLVI